MRAHRILRMTTRILKATTKTEIAEAAREGAIAVRRGKLVGFATETVYGIAVAAGRVAAMRRLRELKSRPKRPFTVHLGRPEDAWGYVSSMPPEAKQLVRKAWPGPLTLLLPVGGALADAKLRKARLYDVLCADDVIGLRCPDHPLAAALLSAAGVPVVAPSANPSGQRAPRNAGDVLAGLDGRIDLLIDSGPTRHGKDSTIVAFDGSGFSIVRRGVLDERMIRRLTRRKVLFVCTGNTCRSPIAAGLARKMLADRFGCRPSELSRRGVEVLSAGLAAASGQRAAPEAVRAAKTLGANIGRHRTQKLTAELIKSCELVFCMTDFHVAEAARMAPGSAGRTRRLDAEGDVPDPIGGGASAYRRAAERIAAALNQLIEEGLL